MATPSGWFWVEEYWKLYGEFNKIWRQLQDRVDWYDSLQRRNNQLERQITRLTRQNDELLVANRRLITENQDLREGASETRQQVEIEFTEQAQAALDKVKAAP